MTYDEWTATPDGSMALTVAVRCDSFAEANAALRIAFNEGRLDGLREARDALRTMGDSVPAQGRATTKGEA